MAQKENFAFLTLGLYRNLIYKEVSQKETCHSVTLLVQIHFLYVPPSARAYTYPVVPVKAIPVPAPHTQYLLLAVINRPGVAGAVL